MQRTALRAVSGREAVIMNATLSDLAMAARFWTDSLPAAVDWILDAGGTSQKAADRRRVVRPMAVGAGIVIAISVIERVVTDCVHSESGAPGPPAPISFSDLSWVNSLGLTLDAHRLDELAAFIRLRHCFAHEYGRVTAKQDADIRTFSARLQAGEVLDEKGSPIPDFISIDCVSQYHAHREHREKPTADVGLGCCRGARAY